MQTHAHIHKYIYIYIYIYYIYYIYYVLYIYIVQYKYSGCVVSLPLCNKNHRQGSHLQMNLKALFPINRLTKIIHEHQQPKFFSKDLS